MGRTLEDVVAELYAAPLEEFTVRRATAAKELRAEDPELAQEVARIPKPTGSTWALDRYARERGDDLDDLLALGDQLREAQRELAGDRLKALTANTTALVQRTLRGVAQLASDAEAPLSDALLLQVEQTLRAALADEDAAAAVRAGVLAKPLSPAGFGPVDLSGAVAVVPAARPVKERKLAVVRPSVDERSKAARKAAEAAFAALEQAESDLAAQTRSVEAAAQEHQEAARQLTTLRRELAHAERTAQAASDRLRDAEKAHDRAERDRAKAAEAAEAAQRAKKAVDATHVRTGRPASD